MKFKKRLDLGWNVEDGEYLKSEHYSQVGRNKDSTRLIERKEISM